MQGVGETPVTWEEHLSSRSLSLENTEGLAEKVGTTGLQSLRKNHSGAAKKRARKARLTEAPTRDSNSSRPQPPRSSQSQILQELGTLGTQKKAKEKSKHRSSTSGPESSGSKGPESLGSKGPSKGPGKHQRLSRALPRAERRRGSSKLGNRAMPELLGRAFG